MAEGLDLKEFLSDPRVIELPRLTWWLILNLFVLSRRPRYSAGLYRKVWTAAGSPLLTISKRLERENRKVSSRARKARNAPHSTA